MNTQNRPRVGQTIGTVVNEGVGLVAKMSLWLQQYLTSVGRNPDSTIATAVVGASPFVYTNTSDFDLDAATTGGVVTTIEFSRDGVNYLYVAFQTNFTFTLNPGDSLRITYSSLPALTIIPR